MGWYRISTEKQYLTRSGAISKHFQDKKTIELNFKLDNVEDTQFGKNNRRKIQGKRLS